MDSKKYVDFHLHSIESTRNKDVIVWQSPLHTLIQLRNNNIKYMAITDHDFFSYKIYKNLNKEINEYKLDIVVFPGVEVTIKRKNGERGHILFIFNNKTEEDKIKKLEQIVYENCNANGINLSCFIDAIKEEYNFTMIPHVGKTYSITYEDIIGFEQYISIVESPNNKIELERFKKLFNHHEINNVMFSDTHNWDNYHGSKVFIESGQDFFEIINNLRMEENNEC